jgi:hypothetical protein
MLPCAYNDLFGLECPSCGFQRAIGHLLQGEFKESFLMFPAMGPVLFYLLITLVHFSNLYQLTAERYKFISYLTLTLVIIGYAARLLFFRN